mgnify:CR=1 FL=1
MDLFDGIKSRRSIRQYGPDHISRSDLHTIMAAADCAPVGMGQYDRFQLIVVEDPHTLEQMENTNGATTVIIVAASKPEPMHYISAGTIVENMALAATGCHVASCVNMAALQNLPAGVIPEGFQPVVCLCLGQTRELLEPRAVDNNKILSHVIKPKQAN